MEAKIQKRRMEAQREISGLRMRRSPGDTRPSTSYHGKPRGSKMGRVQQTRSTTSKQDHALGMSRPGSVPLLFGNNSSLEIQSTPLQLTTRSLSARSSTSTSFASSSKRPGSGVRKRKHTHEGSLKSASDSRLIRTSNSTQSHKLEKDQVGTLVNGSTVNPGDGVGPSPGHSQANSGGFNIGHHLVEQGARLLDNCSSGSLSPEMDQFLRGVDKTLQSPGHSVPSSSHVSGHQRKGLISSTVPHGDQKERNTSAKSTHLGSVSERTKRTHKPVIAVNFPNAPATDPVQQGPTERPDTQPSVGSGSSQLKPDHVQSIDQETKISHTLSAGSGSSCLNSKPVGPSSESAVGDSSLIPPLVAPDIEVQRRVAASRIQRWYRSTREQRYAQVHSLLQEKKEELNRSRVEELQRQQNEAETQEQREAEQLQRRAAKMQAARRAAIKTLQQRREDKRQQAERVAQEEIALLQASGKIKRPKSQRKTKQLPSQNKGKEKKEKEKEEEESGRGGAVVPDAVITEFFEAGGSRHPSQTKPSRHRPHEATKQQPPPQLANTKSTYDDILETLKLLEEAPPPLKESGDTAKGTPMGYLSAENLQRLTTPHVTSTSAAMSRNTGAECHQGTAAQSGSLSETKMHSILSYLDEMERADEDMLSQLARSRSEARTRGLPTPGGGATGGIPLWQQEEEQNAQQLSSDLEAATAVASDVTTTIMAQRLELDNKNKTVEMLQKALSQQRELTVYHAREMEKEGQKRLELQREEYESAVQRHQCFIDQLIDDKKVLSERCEQLVKEMKEMDTKYKHKIKTMEESYAAELAKTRQVAAAADKLRREKWRAEETQRIKEATVKSLEPEIQRIIAKGKAEIQKLKALHEAELLQSDERAGRRFVAQMEELRAQCAAEKEQACAHERELARQRYEKLAEQEELGYQQQRRRLFAEVQQEKDRLAEQSHQQQAALEQTLREMRESAEREVEELKSEHARVQDEVGRRHSAELRDLQERLNIEKQAWEENFMKKQAAAMMTKERELREALRLERDKEIEMVIGRLEEETGSAKAECERAAEARIRRIREKYEAELREVERSERNTLEKFNSMKTQLAELEGEGSRLRSLLRQKEQEVERVGEVASKLTKERDNVADIVRQEFADRLVATEEENKQLKIEMSELRARHRIELERVNQTKEREMAEVHERVKQALEKKEENLRTVRVQHEAALKRADHLEMLLERQRKELVKK